MKGRNLTTPLTPFFPAHVLPAYKGSYKIKAGSYRYFDGRYWYYGSYVGPMQGVLRLIRPRGNLYWNPLADDGDALRLVVKLNIDIVHAFGTRTAVGELTAWYSADGEANYAATRRAIVCAAAALGDNK